MSEIELISIAIASIIVIGIGAQWIAWRFSVPSILLLLLSGLIAGPVTGLIGPQFYETLGDLLMPIVSLAVELILFEGGLTLHLAELPKVGGVVRNLCTFGALVTWVIGSLAARLLFPDLGWNLSILLGAVLVGLWGFALFPLIETGEFLWILVAITGGQIFVGMMYGPQAAFLAELFSTQVRYSGASLGYQLGAIFGGAFAPIIATALWSELGTIYISVYIAFASALTILSVLLLTETFGSKLEHVE